MKLYSKRKSYDNVTLEKGMILWEREREKNIYHSIWGYENFMKKELETILIGIS